MLPSTLSRWKGNVNHGTRQPLQPGESSSSSPGFGRLLGLVPSYPSGLFKLKFFGFVFVFLLPSTLEPRQGSQCGHGAETPEPIGVIMVEGAQTVDPKGVPAALPQFGGI